MRALRYAGVALLAGMLAGGAARAGGPLATRANGNPYTWGAATIQYRTDGGNLSATVNNAAALARVASMFDVWEDIASASISYNRAGAITAIGGFSDGNVSTVSEFNAVDASCDAGSQSPIIFDETAAILIALGLDEDAIIGFAGPCALDPSQGRIVSGSALMNGLFQNGNNADVPDLTAAEFDAAFVHEFGHFSGLDHSQANVECAQFSCGADDRAGLPTMFPFLATDQQRSLSIDDVAWISKLYPATGPSGFAATHGTITGTVLYSDGESHVQVVNVVARRIDTGSNQDRRFAASAVSGYRFRLCTPNPITDPPPDDCPAIGITDAEQIGFYEIPVPAGTYTVEVEAIDPQFVEGSSVGPLEFEQRPLPGTPPAPVGPIVVAPGQASNGNDLVLSGTPPRFDQFEGP